MGRPTAHAYVLVSRETRKIEFWLLLWGDDMHNMGSSPNIRDIPKVHGWPPIGLMSPEVLISFLWKMG